MAAKVNFFLGAAAWKTDVPTYAKVVYRDLYPGIDMIYGGTGRQVKSEFLVAAGADPSLIRLEYSEPVSLDPQGNLMAGDLFREDAPEIYQRIGSKNVKIAGRYRLLEPVKPSAGGFVPYNGSCLWSLKSGEFPFCSYLGVCLYGLAVTGCRARFECQPIHDRLDGCS